MTPSPSPRLSAQARLALLAEVFSVEDLQDGQGLSAKAASVYLARWQSQGRIARLGPRTGLWVNLAKAGEVGLAQRLEGVRRKHPDALVAGRSALAAAGWADAPARPVVAVPQGASRARFDGVDLVFRPPRIHAQLKEAAAPDAGAWEGLPVVAPEVAWADAQAQGDADLPALPPDRQLQGQQAARERGWPIR